MGELNHILETGGIAMSVNICLLVIAVATILDRLLAVYWRYNLSSDGFMAELEKLIAANDLPRAVALCDGAGRRALPRILKAGLTRADSGVLEIGSAIEEETLAVTPLVMKRIPALWSLANMCVLVGLFGTIVGLIKAFKAVGAADPETKSVLLTNGISEAMYNTGFGLALAILCIGGHLVVGSKAKRILEDVELHGLRLENILNRRSLAGTER